MYTLKRRIVNGVYILFCKILNSALIFSHLQFMLIMCVVTMHFTIMLLPLSLLGKKKVLKAAIIKKKNLDINVEYLKYISLRLMFDLANVFFNNSVYTIQNNAV